MNEIEILNVGDVIIVKQKLGCKKYREIECTIEGIYKNFILVRRNDIKTRETITKVDVYTHEVII